MGTTVPDILAFDFDGVLCDGLVEYFQTAWQAHGQLFSHSPATPPPGLAEQFYRLRPVVETGWEMPVLLQALLQGIPEAEIGHDWPSLAQTLVAAADLTPSQATQAVDGSRDRWIQTDLDHWLSQHRFYPGTLERLQQAMAAGVFVVIISTKEGRFIRRLLAQQGIELADEQVFGKEVKQPKYETLRQVRTGYAERRQLVPQVWFLEDRLQALQAVRQQIDLGSVELFLVDWGYNTEADRQQARRQERIHLLSLSQLVQGFDCWIA